MTSIVGMLGVDLTAPDHTTLSRRGQHLALALRRARPGTSLHLIVDSTGLSIVGEGEWAAAKHGGRGRRGWRKLHLGVDGSRVIVACALTEPTADDAITGISLVDEVDGHLTRVTADPAYDTLAFYGAERLSDGTGLVFRSLRGKPLSTVTLSKLIKELGIAAVPHGFRSSFRDWAAERTNTPREVVEAALAHTVQNPTEAAYARSDLFERRRRLMNDWAAYLSGAHGQV